MPVGIIMEITLLKNHVATTGTPALGTIVSVARAYVFLGEILKVGCSIKPRATQKRPCNSFYSSWLNIKSTTFCSIPPIFCLFTPKKKSNPPA